MSLIIAHWFEIAVLVGLALAVHRIGQAAYWLREIYKHMRATTGPPPPDSVVLALERDAYFERQAK